MANRISLILLSAIMESKLKELAIEILQRCPNRCIYCSSLSDLDKSNIIPFEKICQVVDDAKVLSARRICISGGEPFLHPRIVDVVKHVAAAGLECYIYTSGIFYDGRYRSIPVELLNAVKPFVTKLIVNYETTDAERYDVIMGTSCNGLKLLESSILSAVAAGMEVEAHFVPMHINWKDAVSVVERCKQLGVNKVSFLRLVMQGRAHENVNLTALSDDERREFISLVKSISISDGDKAIRLGTPFRGNSFQCACTAGVQKISIRYDGVVHPCESFKNDEPAGLISAKPDNIYDRRLVDIYRDSDYLTEVRGIIGAFKGMRCSESCVNQYYRGGIGK